MPTGTRPRVPKSWSVPVAQPLDEDRSRIVKIEIGDGPDAVPVAFAATYPEGSKKSKEPFVVNLGVVEAIFSIQLREKVDEHSVLEQSNQD